MILLIMFLTEERCVIYFIKDQIYDFHLADNKTVQKNLRFTIHVHLKHGLCRAEWQLPIHCVIDRRAEQAIKRLRNPHLHANKSMCYKFKCIKLTS